MPLGERIAHMPPERRLRIRDLRGELLVGAGDVLPTAPSSSPKRRASFSASCAASWNPCYRKALSRTKAIRSGAGPGPPLH
jgi:hypothetical protein